MDNNIVISIIVPLYRGIKYISKLFAMFQNCCEVANLSKQQSEMLLINDYPDDYEQLHNLKCENNVTILYNEKNIGIHASRVKGLNASLGEYILFLDQDDSISSDYIKSQLEAIGNNDAVFCNAIYRNGETLFSESNKYPTEFTFESYLAYGYPLVSTGQLVLRREIIPSLWKSQLMKYNGWDDHFLWAVLMIAGATVTVNDSVLYIHEEDGNNLSMNWAKMIKSGSNFKEIFESNVAMDTEQLQRFEKLVNRKLYKYNLYMNLSEKWEQLGETKIVDYLKFRGYKSIAIYGIGIFGQRLLKELSGTDIAVLYCIDKRKDNKKVQCPIYSVEEKWPDADVIIVTPVFSYNEIKKILVTKCDCDVISLEDVISCKC